MTIPYHRETMGVYALSHMDVLEECMKARTGDFLHGKIRNEWMWVDNPSQ